MHINEDILRTFGNLHWKSSSDTAFYWFITMFSSHWLQWIPVIANKKNNIFTTRLPTKLTSSLNCFDTTTGLSSACGILCMANIPTSKKFTYATLTNSLQSRLYFILIEVLGQPCFFSLSDIPFILHARH